MLSVRPVFISNNSLTMHVQTDKPAYDRRERVNLDISTTDVSGRPVFASLAVSVSDSALTPESSLFLPAADDAFNTGLYLMQAKDMANAERDLYMLIQKDRFKNRRQAMGETQAVEDSFLHIQRTVYTAGQKPAPQKVVVLFSKEGGVLLDTDTTDITGGFHFPVSGYADSTQFMLRTTSLAGRAEALNILLR
jgi:hypothetical protein